MLPTFSIITWPFIPGSSASAPDKDNLPSLRDIAGVYKAKIIDLSPDSLVMELTGKPEKVEGFLNMMRNYEVLEMSTCTVIVMFAMPGSIVSEVVMLSMLKLRRLNIFEIRASTP